MNKMVEQFCEAKASKYKKIIQVSQADSLIQNVKFDIVSTYL